MTPLVRKLFKAVRKARDKNSVRNAWAVLMLLSCAAFPQQPASFDDHMRLGQSYLDRGDAGRALSEFESSVQLKPRVAEAQYRLGVALRLWGDLQGAEAALKEALRLQPHFPEAHFVLGLVLGDHVGGERLGLAEFQAAIAQNPSFAEAHFNIGIIQWKAGDVDRAIDSFGSAVAQQPNSAEFHF